MAGPYNIPVVTYTGTDPDPVEWANLFIKPAIDDLDLRFGKYNGINAQTGTSYTPVLADQGKFVTLTNAAAITVTLPQDSDVAFPISAQVDFQVRGAGMATFVAGTGATVDGTPSLVTRAQYSAVTLIKISANGWTAVGDLT